MLTKFTDKLYFIEVRMGLLRLVWSCLFGGVGFPKQVPSTGFSLRYVESIITSALEAEVLSLGLED